jgi:two-component system NtrC family sensor kinase
LRPGDRRGHIAGDAIPWTAERMTARPTLRRELVTAFALVFACALIVMAVGVALLLPLLDSPRSTALYLTALLAADVAIFAWFGRYLVQRRIVRPIEKLIEGVEAMADGDLGRRLPDMGTAEFARLTGAVSRMAERLVADQRELAANIRSLDSTNRMLTEARNAMIQAEKMASVGRLGAGIAHEVGNPLGAILGYLGLLRRGADDGRLELVTAAEREAQRIDRIVRGLLEYARPRETRTQPTRVGTVVTDTVELLQIQGRFERIRLDVDLADDLPPVMADPYQLQQVLVNLLVNAADALADTAAPAIRLRAILRTAVVPVYTPARRRDDPPGIDYSHRRRLAAPVGRDRHDPVSATGEIVEITVADNGPGIPRAMIDQVFEPFVTTKEPGRGTGLGLAVCARLVEAMGGAIRAESREGDGATFTVLLPAGSAEPATSET